MKKTITVNLGGRAFQITEDAYAQLSDYLSSIADCLKNHEGGEEIAADIESRISELCEERLHHNTIRIIDCELVNDMIKRIGNPKNMFAVNGGEDETPVKDETVDGADVSAGNAEDGNAQKVRLESRYYRNVDDKMIAGVMSGLSVYLEHKHPNVKLDTTALRILAAVFLVALPPLTLIAYLLVWFIAPAAGNTADKLRMEGVEPTPENIASKIADTDYKDVKSNEKSSDGGTNRILIPLLFVIAAILLSRHIRFLSFTMDYSGKIILLSVIIMIPILYISYNIMNIIKKLSSGKAIFVMFLLALFLFFLMFLSVNIAKHVL